ncbi:hypothetical protein L915_09523 [Phytophthora nicotianae]|uniref:Uncharacterized protein n=1 Tax=Phytophthora nicotianae TaxID=4792 RepID=W2GTY9_PHYNI|nr:hypothetical protein L915_09523 [Phytophthora nicotianae]
MYGKVWPALPVRNMAVRRINDAIRHLDRSQVENSLTPPPDGSDGVTFELCDATQADWNHYVQSEQQSMRSRWMVWLDDRILIVEF